MGNKLQKEQAAAAAAGGKPEAKQISGKAPPTKSPPVRPKSKLTNIQYFFVLTLLA